MVVDQVLHKRWGFLAPWCQVLRTRIRPVWPEREEEVMHLQTRRLEVALPTRCDGLWGSQLQKIREALALLGAVAYVDQTAWKYLLGTYCDLELVEEDGDIPVRFVLSFMDSLTSYCYPETLKADLVQFCGVNQVTDSSREYEVALTTIAILDSRLRPDQPGVEIHVPVQVWFGMSWSKDKSTKPLEDIQRAAIEIRDEWERYGQHDVMPGLLRCTLVLEPTIVDFNDYILTPSVGETLEQLVRENTWFSQVSLWMNSADGIRSGEQAAVQTMGQIMRLFGNERRPYKLSSTKYHRIGDEEFSPTQIGMFHLVCASSLGTRDVEAICSGVAVCQTTRKLSVRMEISSNQQINGHWWKWLAYALFSKRSRACSSIESVSLLSITSMSNTDMEAFSSVLMSEHPEEELYGCSRGEIEERKATVKEGAAIYWQINRRGMPRRESRITLSSNISAVRCFSDDRASPWVNAIVPGYGRCLVQRRDLVLSESNEGNIISGGVTTLKIGFEKEEDSGEGPTISDGLSRFLELVGPTLKVLTLDGPRVELAEHVIIQNCPNLEELGLCEYFIDARFDFSKYRAKNQPTPCLKCNWEDIGAIAAELSDLENPLTKCVYRLRIRLMNRQLSWGNHPKNYDSLNFGTHVAALLQMLEINRSLVYLDVVVPDKDNDVEGLSNVEVFATDFKKYHLKPISRSIKLSMETKIAFLSVATRERTNTKKTRSSRTLSTLIELNQHVLSNIFSLAATPILREVHFREPRADCWEEERIYVDI